MRSRDMLHPLSRIAVLLAFFCLFGTAASAGVLADITANGSGSAITVKEDATVSIVASLYQIGMDEVEADWWVVVNTPFGWFHYDVTSQAWKPGLVATVQIPIRNLPFTTVFNGKLPAGQYTFYFGVDTVKNGQPDMAAMTYDTIKVTVIGDPLTGTWVGTNGLKLVINRSTQAFSGTGTSLSGLTKYYSGSVYWPTFSSGVVAVTGDPYTQNVIKMTDFDALHMGDRIDVEAHEAPSQLRQTKIVLTFRDEDASDNQLTGTIIYLYYNFDENGNGPMETYSRTISFTKQ